MCEVAAILVLLALGMGAVYVVLFSPPGQLGADVESDVVRVTITIGDGEPREFFVHQAIIDAMGDDPAWFMLDGAMYDVVSKDK